VHKERSRTGVPRGLRAAVCVHEDDHSRTPGKPGATCRSGSAWSRGWRPAARRRIERMVGGFFSSGGGPSHRGDRRCGLEWPGHTLDQEPFTSPCSPNSCSRRRDRDRPGGDLRREPGRGKVRAGRPRSRGRGPARGGRARSTCRSSRATVARVQAQSRSRARRWTLTTGRGRWPAAGRRRSGGTAHREEQRLARASAVKDQVRRPAS